MAVSTAATSRPPSGPVGSAADARCSVSGHATPAAPPLIRRKGPPTQAPQMLIWTRACFGGTRRAVGSEGTPWDISIKRGLCSESDRPHTAPMRQTHNQVLVCGQLRPPTMTHVRHVPGAAAGFQHPRWENSVSPNRPCRELSAGKAAPDLPEPTKPVPLPISPTRTWKVGLSKSPQPGGDRACLGQGTLPQDPTPGDRQLLWPRVRPTWRSLCPVV